MSGSLKEKKRAKMDDSGYIRVGREWMSTAEYRRRFKVPVVEKMPACQLELFANIPGRGATIDDRFADFHQKNPHVYRNLVRLALDDAARGIKRGVAALFEDLRYAYESTDHDPAEYKLNNDFASRYSRLIMKTEPRLSGHFEVRGLKSR